MLHIFWDCPKLAPFWHKVICTVKHLTNVDLEGNPAACLLHLSDRPIRKYNTSLTIQLLNAARACITFVGDRKTPRQNLWFSKVNELRDMEDLTATLHNREETSRETWRPWNHFVYTDAYIQQVAHTS